MQEPLKLNFPPLELRLREVEGVRYAWSEPRRQWLVLTPEEWVRRHLVAFLVAHCGAQPLRIVEEYPVLLNGQPQRADLVVVDDAGRPLLLAECKAPEVKISQGVYDQAVRYNAVLGARFVVLTNGCRHYCYEQEKGAYRAINSFPNLGGRG